MHPAGSFPLKVNSSLPGTVRSGSCPAISKERNRQSAFLARADFPSFISTHDAAVSWFSYSLPTAPAVCDAADANGSLPLSPLAEVGPLPHPELDRQSIYCQGPRGVQAAPQPLDAERPTFFSFKDCSRTNEDRLFVPIRRAESIAMKMGESTEFFFRSYPASPLA